MALQHKDSHIAEALANLVSQFRGKAYVEATLSAFVQQVQDLEDVFFELLEERFIDDAVGAQLDGFGSIVGEARESRPDDEYKTAIKARIQLNLGNGTPEDIIGLVRSVAGNVRVKVTDYYPAAFIADVVDPIDPLVIDPARLLAIVQTGKPAGVYASVTYHVVGEFKFDTGPGFDEGKYGGAL